MSKGHVLSGLKNIAFNLYWYSRESSPLTLPPKVASVFVWFILSRILSRFVRKKDGKITVAFTSIYFNGNARAVFEYMTEKFQDKYSCYWIARNIVTFKYLRKLKKPVIYLCFPFAASNLVANTSVLVTNDSYLRFIFGKKIKTVQLWHGEGGKGASKPDIPGIQCVPSQYIKKRYIELWNIDPEKLFVTGYARMDFLYRYLNIPRKYLLRELSIREGRKIILYAPTFDVGLWPWGDEYKGFEELCRFCKERKLTLIIRLHPLAKVSKRKLRKIVKKYPNVHLYDMAKEPDTMKLLAVADILITAWSSIDNEFFLTERPIIYLEKDKEFFVERRGKMKIPIEYRAGEVVSNVEEFYKALERVLARGNAHKEKQRRLLKLLHGRVDGKATERVVQIIEDYLRRDA